MSRIGKRKANIEDDCSDQEEGDLKQKKQCEERIDAQLFVRDFQKTKDGIHAKHKLSLIPGK